MSLSRILLLFLLPVAWAYSQQPADLLDLPSLDKPPTLTLPPPKIVPVEPNAADGKPATIKPPPPAEAPLPALPPEVKAATPKSTSANGQFIIHGADLPTRSWFNSYCEESAVQLQRLLRDNQGWGIPVVLSLRTPPDISLTEPAVAAVVSELTQGGFQLQVTVQLRSDLNANDLRWEIIRILLAERILRGHQKLTTTRNRILPEWLLVGVTEALRYRERSRPSALFAAVFKTGKVYGIEELLEASPGKLDSLSRTIYETSCCALVLMLLDQPEGPMRMAKLLNSLATETRTDREIINEWFPAIAQSKSSLDKWWTLQMANLSRPSVFETLDPAATAKELEQALTFRYESEIDVEVAAPSSRRRSESATKEDPAAAPTEDQPKERTGLLSRIFGGGNKQEEAPEDDKPAESGAPAKKPQPPPPNKEAAAASQPKSKAQPEPKTPAKPENKTETKSTVNKASNPDAKAEEPAQEEAAKRPGLFRRIFGGGGKTPEPSAPPASDTKAKEKSKETPAKKGSGTDKKESPTAAIMNSELWLRAASDLALPGLNLWLDTRRWLSGPGPRPAILGFGKKKDDKAKEEEAAKDAADGKAKKETAAKASASPRTSTRKRKVQQSAPIEDYALILKRSDAKQVLGAVLQNLAGLTQRAHPLFRPLISEYATVIGEMAKGPDKALDARLRELKQKREQTLAQARTAQDFTDWYQASENTKWSGLFDDYLRVPQAISSEMPKRVDTIARLLDEVEANNSNGQH